MSNVPTVPTTATDSLLASESLPLHLPPELLKARLADLIRAAVTQGAATVAETVVRHFQALSLHPELIANGDERAAYCRGARHWRGLATIDGGAAATPACGSVAGVA